MFFIYFILILIFCGTNITNTFIYLYILYIQVYLYNSFIFFTKPQLGGNYTFKHINNLTKYFKTLVFLVQTSLNNYRFNIFWKPLFRKISYFGFYRNINNISKK